MLSLKHCNILAGMVVLSVCPVPGTSAARASDTSVVEAVKPLQYRPPAATVQPREPGSNGLSFGCPPTMSPPVLLMPKGHTGQTIAAHPTFFAFVPAAATVQFLVIEPGSSKTVYSTNFTSKTAGIVRLLVPETAPPLTVDQEYWWYVSVLCDPKYARDRSYLQGWVKRVTPVPTLLKQLEQATVGDRPAVYGMAGIWYDMLTTLADLRRSYPHDRRLLPIWTDLLKSVGLGSITDQPLIELSDSGTSSLSPAAGTGGQYFRPPNLKLPGRNTGGGTR